MAEEIKEEKKLGCCSYSYSPIIAIFIIVAIILVVGAAFAAGRVSSRKFAPNRIGKIQNTMMQRRGFGGRQMMGQRGGGEFTSVRVSGTVSAINDSNITVKTSSKDVTVIANDQTSYLKAGEIAKATDLKVNDAIVAVGQSNAAGEIAANLISIR